MEIITGVEWRRQWRGEEKLRILAELDEPGAKFSAVARRHDISRGLLWQWRDAQRRGRLVAETPGFVPVQVVPELDHPNTIDGLRFRLLVPYPLRFSSPRRRLPAPAG